MNVLITDADRAEAIKGMRTAISGSWITASIVLLLTLVSTALMLHFASPELIWDEADYALNLSSTWQDLWSRTGYHAHGPLMIYLAKLGDDLLPPWIGSIEDRLRLPIALFSSAAAGFTYWSLRSTFAASPPAAILGSTLLTLSVIRLRETHILGPHHLMLLWTICVFAFGYRWRNTESHRIAILMGVLFGFAALTMTYVIPLAVCWVVAVTAAGGTWVQADRKHLKISWLFVTLVGAGTLVLTLLWPPAILRAALLNDFVYYLRVAKLGFPTLLGNEITEVPRSEYLFSFLRFDAPILLLGLAISIGCLRSWMKYRLIPAKWLYVAAFSAVMLVTTLSAHFAGARNLLQLSGICCLGIGALFDDIVKGPWWAKKTAVSAAVAASALNLLFWSQSDQIPLLAANGLRAFVNENRNRLAESVSAITDGPPMLAFYAERSGVPVAWTVEMMPWTTQPDAAVPLNAKYALISELSYSHMPASHPVRRIIDREWKVVWSFKEEGSWGLRLYQRP